jgi:hypothetical protein
MGIIVCNIYKERKIIEYLQPTIWEYHPQGNRSLEKSIRGGSDHISRPELTNKIQNV